MLVTPDLRVKTEPRKDRTPREVAEGSSRRMAWCSQMDRGRPGWSSARQSRPRRPRQRTRRSPRSPTRFRRAIPRRHSRCASRSRSKSTNEWASWRARLNVYAVDVARAIDTAGSLENVFQTLPWLPGVASTNDHDGKFAYAAPVPSTTPSCSMACRFTVRNVWPAISAGSRASSTPRPSPTSRSTRRDSMRGTAVVSRRLPSSKRATELPAGGWRSRVLRA